MENTRETNWSIYIRARVVGGGNRAEKRPYNTGSYFIHVIYQLQLKSFLIVRYVSGILNL